MTADDVTAALDAVPPAAPAPPDAERQAAPLLDTPPPQNLEAEHAVLGSMILDTTGAAATTCTRMLRADNFLDPACRVLFGFLAAHRESDERADLVALEGSLAAAGLLDAIGGRAFLLELSDAVPVLANAPIYARLVRRAAAQRTAVQAGLELAKRAGEGGADVPELL